MGSIFFEWDQYSKKMNFLYFDELDVQNKLCVTLMLANLIRESFANITR